MDLVLKTNMDDKFQVRINKEKCLGCGTCAALMPEAFEMDSEGKSTVKPNQKSSDEMLMVAKSCPTGAIEIYDEADKKVWPE